MALSMAGFYHAVYQKLPQFLKDRINPLDRDIEDFVRQAADDAPPGAVVLDAGAGEARFAEYFRAHKYVALDSGVGDAEWDYSRIHVRASLDALPLASESVDVAVNTQVLEHVANPAGALREIQRVLRPGGRLYLTAPQGWHEHQQPHDFFRFTQYSLRLLLGDAGFKEISIQPQGGYFRYLGHRLSYVPKVLFQRRRGLLRVAFFPFELAALALFCFISPIAFHYMDRFDSQREFTLGYRCLAVK